MYWRLLECRVYTNIFAHKYRSCIIVRDIDRGETNPGIGDVLLKKKIIFLMIASVFLAFFNNLTFLFGTCYPGNTTDDMFVSSIFDSIKSGENTFIDAGYAESVCIDCVYFCHA